MLLVKVEASDQLVRTCQEPVLFSGSIADNIRYGKKEATDREVVAAAEQAHAAGFIRGFAAGSGRRLGRGACSSPAARSSAWCAHD